MSLEKVVRPFQSGDVFTARTITPVLPSQELQLSQDVCRVEFEGTNPGQYNDIPSDQMFNNFQAEWREDVSQRVMEEVRIEQDDNPDNFVVVERMQSTVLRNDRTGGEFAIKFADWAGGRS